VRGTELYCWQYSGGSDMRTPQSLALPVSQEPVPKPYRHIRFFPCQRCMAHGQFMTVPADETPFVVFSQDTALFYIGMLHQTRRISENQFCELMAQVTCSGLPRTISRTVKEIVASEMGSWTALAELASISVRIPRLVSGFMASIWSTFSTARCLPCRGMNTSSGCSNARRRTQVLRLFHLA
jgi:hypothetical protein